LRFPVFLDILAQRVLTVMKLLRKIGQRVYKWWMAFARALAIANTVLLLTVVYVILIGPVSLVARIVGKDLLMHRIRPSRSFWRPKEPVAHTLDQARHQF
jgi:hypothetical protein